MFRAWKGESYPFRFSRVSVADLGVKRIWGTGEVYHLSRLEDFAGDYDAVSLRATIAGGLDGEPIRRRDPSSRRHAGVAGQPVDRGRPGPARRRLTTRQHARESPLTCM